MANGDENTTNRTDRVKALATVAVVLVVFLLVFFAWAYAPRFVNAFHLVVHDPFSALDTLFDGLAFFAVAVAILLQTQELALQRKELRRSTEAQKEAGQALSARLALEEKLATDRAALDREIADQRAKLDRTIAEKRAELEINVARTRLTLSLFDEWYSHELQQAKVKLQSYMQSEGFFNNISLTRLTVNNASEVGWFIRVFGFFRKWSVLAAEQQIDDDLLHRLIGYDARWWHDNFAVRFTSARETRADYKELLESVFAGAMRRYHAG